MIYLLEEGIELVFFFLFDLEGKRDVEVYGLWFGCWLVFVLDV